MVGQRICIRVKQKIKMKQQIIAFVGPDMTGKSNIARALSNKLLIPVFKASSEHGTFLGDQKQFINDIRYADPRVVDLLKQVGFSVIFDRAYPCEKVYAEFFGRETDHDVLKFLDEEYAKLGTKIVICTRRSFEGIKDDLDPNLDATALEKLSNLYEKFSLWTKCSVHTMYVDDENLSNQINEVCDFVFDRTI